MTLSIHKEGNCIDLDRKKFNILLCHAIEGKKAPLWVRGVTRDQWRQDRFWRVINILECLGSGRNCPHLLHPTYS